MTVRADAARVTAAGMLLRELAAAAQSLALYPAGHPRRTELGASLLEHAQALNGPLLCRPPADCGPVTLPWLLWWGAILGLVALGVHTTRRAALPAVAGLLLGAPIPVFLLILADESSLSRFLQSGGMKVVFLLHPFLFALVFGAMGVARFLAGVAEGDEVQHVEPKPAPGEDDAPGGNQPFRAYSRGVQRLQHRRERTTQHAGPPLCPRI